jgi:hypothetical protein
MTHAPRLAVDFPGTSSLELREAGYREANRAAAVRAALTLAAEILEPTA